MRTDLDRLMKERGYDALLVTGGTAHNPPMFYLANGVKVGEATLLVKKRGRPPVLIANDMERDEAAKSGLQVVSLAKYGMAELLREEKGNRVRAAARLYGRVLADQGVRRGTVAAFGTRDQGAAYRLLSVFNRLRLGVRVVGEYDDSVFDRATATKDADEIRRIRAVGRKTVGIVGETQEFLASHRARGGYLVKKDGRRLTIGDVKRHIRQLMQAAGVEDPEAGTIFAIGRDAGVPHSRGEDRQPIALGKSIIYDIFPCEAGGGYHFDFTRTWCLGYAPPEVERAYADVLDAFNAVRQSLRAGAPCGDYQRLVCDLFEARGHPTLRTDPRTTSGYVHSLGHGVGLRIHEWPFFRDSQGSDDRLEPGAVITVEPGLYYPDRRGGGFGVRLEDTLWLNPKTEKFEALADYPKDLVVKVRG